MSSISKPSLMEKTKEKSSARLIGPTKPRNPTVKNTINVNRAPTEEEFFTNLVEKPILWEELYPEPKDATSFWAVIRKLLGITWQMIMKIIFLQMNRGNMSTIMAIRG